MCPPPQRCCLAAGTGTKHATASDARGTRGPESPGCPLSYPKAMVLDSPPGVDPSILTPQVRCHIPEGSIGLDR